MYTDRQTNSLTDRQTDTQIHAQTANTDCVHGQTEIEEG